MMSFIEGVGDEVVAFAVILLVLILAATVTFFLNSSPFSTEHQQISQVQSESSPVQVIQIYHSLIVVICFTLKNIVVYDII